MREFSASLAKPLLKLADSFDWLAPLLMRLYFGYFWLETGWAKLHNLDGATQRFVEWGIPYPGFSATFSAGAEFVGGLLLMIGLLTRFTSVALAINMVVALAVVVLPGIGSVDEFFELDEVLYIFIFAWLLIAGPGRASLDYFVRRWLRI